jgi:hypothetical protein
MANRPFQAVGMEVLQELGNPFCSLWMALGSWMMADTVRLVVNLDGITLGGLASRPMGAVPVDRLLQSLFESRVRAPAELALSATDVEAAARLSVGLADIPDDSAVETGKSANQLYEIFDGDLDASSHVHRVGFVISFGGE